jgi:hypothetical protein
MSARDSSKPVSPRNPDIRFTVLAGCDRRSLEPLGQFHTQADAEGMCRERRTEFALLVIQEVRHYAPLDESAPWRIIPVLGVVS